MDKQTCNYQIFKTSTMSIIQKTISLFIVLIGLSLSSCIKETIDNDLESNFQFLWDEFDQNYAVFEARKIDWDSMYQIYHPQAAAANTEGELWSILTEMLDVLDDGHVDLYGRNGESFSSGFTNWEYTALREFDWETVLEYLDETREFTYEYEGETFQLGAIGKIRGTNFAYMRIQETEGDGNGWEDEMLAQLADYADTDGLIFDIRNNGGGEDSFAGKIAGAVAAEEMLAYRIYDKNGPRHNDFADPTEHFIEKIGDFQYTKPIVVLTNHFIASAAEVLLLYLQTQDHITIIGDSTLNAFSSISFLRFMPNGWSFALSHQLYEMPNGFSPEGTGIVPDIYFRNDTNEVNNGIDRLLEKGIEELQ